MGRTSKNPAIRVVVSVARLETGNSSTLLTAMALGSCVAAIVFDPVTRIGGMAHILLPDSKQSPSAMGSNPGKFADTAIPALIERMKIEGANSKRLVAKIVGGAKMFEGPEKKDEDSIGERNVKAAKSVLEKKKIKVVAKDIGGNRARTVEFEPASGRVKIYSVGKSIASKVL